MNCIICINLSLKVIFILQSQFVSHLDRMSSFRGASLPILSIPKTVSKSAVTHIGMHSPPSIHTPGYSMCTVSSSLSSFWGSHIPVKYFSLQDFNVAAKVIVMRCFEPWAGGFLSGPHLAVLIVFHLPAFLLLSTQKLSFFLFYLFLASVM